MDACRRASVVDLRAAVTTPRGGGAYCTVVVIVCIPYLRYRRVSNTIEGYVRVVLLRSHRGSIVTVLGLAGGGILVMRDSSLSARLPEGSRA